MPTRIGLRRNITLENASAWAVVKEQSATIERLKAEMDELRHCRSCLQANLANLPELRAATNSCTLDTNNPGHRPRLRTIYDGSYYHVNQAYDNDCQLESGSKPRVQTSRHAGLADAWSRVLNEVASCSECPGAGTTRELLIGLQPKSDQPPTLHNGGDTGA